jgi:hypothetical protein
MNVNDNDACTLSKTNSEIVFVGYSSATVVDRGVAFMMSLNMTPVTTYPVMCTFSMRSICRDQGKSKIKVAASNGQLIYMSAENIIRYWRVHPFAMWGGVVW